MENQKITQVKCVGCGKISKPFKRTGCFTKDAEKAEFRFHTDLECNIFWLCPTCDNKARQLANEFQKIVNVPNIFLDSFLD